MFDHWQAERPRADRDYLFDRVLVPAVATFLAMAVGFVLVFAGIQLAEGILLSSILTRILTLAVMLVFPHVVVGIVLGVRYGLDAVPPLVAGVTPPFVTLLSLGAFGGPIPSLFESPLVLLGAIVVWSGLCAGGMVLGTNVVKPRFAARTGSQGEGDETEESE
jgi:hypothetical protein